MSKRWADTARRALIILLGDVGDDAFQSAVPYAILTEDNFAIDTEDGQSIDIEHPDAP